jgi:hypothetical protein
VLLDPRTPFCEQSLSPGAHKRVIANATAPFSSLPARFLAVSRPTLRLYKSGHRTRRHSTLLTQQHASPPCNYLINADHDILSMSL